MRRRSNASIINLIIFLFVLLVILYLNVPVSERSKTFAWTTIRYKTAAASLPNTEGICPGLAEQSKPALVVAHVSTDGEASWLDLLANRYHLCIYQADLPSSISSNVVPRSGQNYLPVPLNRGHEAMAYLTFLIDNYHSIPAAGAVFVHGSRFSWHNDHPEYDNVALLNSLNTTSALESTGYHNLRCDWSASTCSKNNAPPQGSLETRMRSVLEPFNARVVSDRALPQALTVLFGGVDAGKSGAEQQVHLGLSDTIRAQCCAQFVVSRERVWQHSRDEYVALRQWLIDDVAPQDDKVAGRILSYMWHILFLPHSSERAGIDLKTLNTLACPRADECYCRLYGRCGLKHCSTPGRCKGQYGLPLNFRLPDDWAATHS